MDPIGAPDGRVRPRFVGPGLEVEPWLVHQVADAGDLAPNPFDIGEAYTHGTPFRRAFEEGLLAQARSAHVGIRGPIFGKQDLVDDAGMGFEIVSTVDVARAGVDSAVERIRARVGESPVYISIDIDVLDPAHAPGTGTPEPGGLSTRELMLILRGMCGLPIVGADVVEVAPPYDHAELTALAAANVAYECLALFALAPDASAAAQP